MLIVQEALVSTQDSTLGLMAMAALNPPEAVLALVNAGLERNRVLDKSLREKLLVLLMAKEISWLAADHLERRMRGEYLNPHVAKVLEEESKLKEKKDKKAKEKSASTASSAKGKRSQPYSRLPMRQPMAVGGYGSQYYPQQPVPFYQPMYQGGANAYPGPQPYTRSTQPDKVCFRCGQKGHLIRDCTEKHKP